MRTINECDTNCTFSDDERISYTLTTTRLFYFDERYIYIYYFRHHQEFFICKVDLAIYVTYI